MRSGSRSSFKKTISIRSKGIAKTARDASPREVYAKERAELATHPHHAAYWLLAHALHGDTGAQDVFATIRSWGNAKLS